MNTDKSENKKDKPMRNFRDILTSIFQSVFSFNMLINSRSKQQNIAHDEPVPLQDIIQFVVNAGANLTSKEPMSTPTSAPIVDNIAKPEPTSKEAMNTPMTPTLNELKSNDPHYKILNHPYKSLDEQDRERFIVALEKLPGALLSTFFNEQGVAGSLFALGDELRASTKANTEKYKTLLNELDQVKVHFTSNERLNTSSPNHLEKQQYDYLLKRDYSKIHFYQEGFIIALLQNSEEKIKEVFQRQSPESLTKLKETFEDRINSNNINEHNLTNIKSDMGSLLKILNDISPQPVSLSQKNYKDNMNNLREKDIEKQHPQQDPQQEEPKSAQSLN